MSGTHGSSHQRFHYPTSQPRLQGTRLHQRTFQYKVAAYREDHASSSHPAYFKAAVKGRNSYTPIVIYHHPMPCSLPAHGQELMKYSSTLSSTRSVMKIHEFASILFHVI